MGRRELGQGDERVGERHRCRRLLSAHAFEDRMALDLRDHRKRLRLVDGREAQGDVLQDF